MSATRLELKVGMFVIVLLGLAAVMTLKFSETGLGLTKTIPLKFRSSSAGTVIANAPIHLSGVKIGVVDKVTLNDDGRGVIIHAGIFEDYWSALDSNTQFRINVTGLMGDEYVAAIPGKEKGKPLKSGAVMDCEAPFDLMTVARDAQQLIRRVDNSMITLDVAINRLDQTVLSTETLTNLTAAIAEIKGTTEYVNKIAGSIHNKTVPGINHFVDFLSTNTPALKQGLDDFTRFTKRLDGYADDLESFASTNRVVIEKFINELEDISGIVKATTTDLQATFSTNRNDINLIVKDVRKVTADLKKFTEKSNRILDDLEAGKGLAGGLLKDDAMRTEFFQMIKNLSTTAKSVTRLADQLKEKGLLTKPPPTKFTPPPKSGRPR